jgi:hypothetical protein
VIAAGLLDRAPGFYASRKDSRLAARMYCEQVTPRDELPPALFKKGDRKMSDNIDDFLAVCSPAVRDLAQLLRGLIRRVMPNAIEHVDLPSNIIGYGYDRTYANLICAITPYKAHVSLLFTRGATLPDPEHLLEGEGKTARRVRIATPADVDDPAVKALLTSAAAAGR